MTIDELKEIYCEHEESEYLEFASIEKPEHVRRDICAFLMLHKFSDENANEAIISKASYDEIYFDIKLEKIIEKLKKQDIINLIRCGVRLGTEQFSGKIYHYFYMNI